MKPLIPNRVKFSPLEYFSFKSIGSHPGFSLSGIELYNFILTNVSQIPELMKKENFNLTNLT